MIKTIHEIRDPIHVFVRMDSDERKVLNSRPFQRMRYIHQLALSYLVYPGATHRRFEHSLGVMELAGRAFDVVTHAENLVEGVRNQFPEIANEDTRRYWRRVVRMAALCHDLGHLPFSHAAEKQLLPGGWTHERLSKELILSPEMKAIWDGMTPPLRANDIVKLAVGPFKEKDSKFSNWEAILSEIIVGDSFGVDRIDYLLRDSHHTGVGYGKFDHYRLIDNLRILPSPTPGPSAGEEQAESVLGVEEGGIHSAEALLLARYFMYTQVYIHPIRRIYDIHLQEFLSEWLPNRRFSTDLEDHLRMTDNEALAAMLSADLDEGSKGHAHARRIVRREHFKILYQRQPSDVAVNPDAAKAVYGAAANKFDADNVRYDEYRGRGGGVSDFPVLTKDERVVSAIALSDVLKNLPVTVSETVFIAPNLTKDAKKWLDGNRTQAIEPSAVEE